jgi:UDP-N-acetylmuramoyl-tripeptide--D-alanyl-D-alanine ligase
MPTSISDLYTIYRKYQKVCTDTRKLVPNSIFFALKGDKFNANEFAEKALKEGCSYAVIDDAKYKKGNKYIVFDDVLTALQDLAKYHRSMLTIPIIGITGSNGKTTTKELVRNVLAKKYRTLATEGNLNNHIGVPLTILSITDEYEIAIIEMGANHQGEIEALCNIAKPDFGLITNIGKAHLEGFGGITGVLKGKTELYQHLQKNNGTAFLYADNPTLMNVAKGMELCTYGASGLCNLAGRLINSDNFIELKWRGKKDPLSLDEKPVITTQLTGKHNYENILAACCIGNYFNISVTDINAAITEYLPANYRSQIIKKGTNLIFMDAYNANPTSMSAAIEYFAANPQKEKLAILGDMFELGAFADEEHKAILKLLKEKNLKNVILVGPNFVKQSKGSSSFKTFNTTEEAAKFVKQQKIKNTYILVKGSRGMKLENVSEAI